MNVFYKTLSNILTKVAKHLFWRTIVGGFFRILTTSFGSRYKFTLCCFSLNFLLHLFIYLFSFFLKLTINQIVQLSTGICSRRVTRDNEGVRSLLPFFENRERSVLIWRRKCLDCGHLWVDIWMSIEMP